MIAGTVVSRADAFRRQAWESGLTCAAFATVIFSLSALQVKLTGGRVPVLELCVIRSSISFCTSVSLGTVNKIKPLFGHRRHLPLLFLRGLFGTAAIACSYAALLNLPLGDAVTLQQLRPPMMAVMGRLLLNEPLGWVGAAGCLISLTGATIVSHPPFLFGGHSTWGPQRLLGTLCGIASPCFGSGTGYCIRRIQKQEPALVVALWFHTVTVGLLVWPLLAGWPQAAAMVEAQDAGLLVGISCSSFCAQLLMTRAFQLLPAARAASLNFLGVVYSHALGILVFGEELTLFTVAGTLLIFTGVLLVAFRARSSNSSSSSSSSDSGKQAGRFEDSREDPGEAVPLKALDQQQQQQQQDQEVDLDQQQQKAGLDTARTVRQQQQQGQHQEQQQQQQKGVLAASAALQSDVVSRDQQLGVHHTAAAAAAQHEAVQAVGDVELGLCPGTRSESVSDQQQQQQQQQQHSNKQQPLLAGHVYSCPAGALRSGLQ